MKVHINPDQNDSIEHKPLWAIWFIGVGLLALFGLNFKAYASEKTVSTERIGPNWQYFSQLDHAGFALLDSNGHVLQSKNSHEYYVPASTTKLITALLAIEHWGLEHRFKTQFYIRQQEQKTTLVVKGYGDPYLVSEELELIAEQLRNKLRDMNVVELSSVELDVSYYESNLVMPGTSQSLNPYDAIPSALAANFNTIHAVKAEGQIHSAETQTLMVDTGALIVKQSSAYARQKVGKKFRINLGTDVRLTQQYFAELLMAFMEKQGVQFVAANTQQAVSLGEHEPTDKLLYTHYNSRTLADVIKPMMKYSTNFIANQLALNLAADIAGIPATQDKVRQVYSNLLTSRFDWTHFMIEEGAGLSRNNRITPNQLLDVLDGFKPWVHLLPEVEKHVYAKSGSLIGVSTLAGYIEQNAQLLPFSMMINQKVPYHFRNKLAREVAQYYQVP